MSITPVVIPKKHTYGYMVRVSRKGHDIPMVWVHADGEEGMSLALEKAKAKETEILANVPPVQTSKNRMTKRNRSGIVGVHYTTDERILRSGENAAYPNYTARWPGFASGLSWSVNKFGIEGAFLLAALSRGMECKDRSTVEEALRILKPQEKSDLLKLRKNEEG